MSVRKIVEDGVSSQLQRDVLAVDGQVIDILADLPNGYEYKLIPLSRAINSPITLAIVKKEMP